MLIKIKSRAFLDRRLVLGLARSFLTSNIFETIDISFFLFSARNWLRTRLVQLLSIFLVTFRCAC